LRGLLSHRATNFGYPVTNTDHGGLTGRIEKPSAVSGNYPRAFAASRDRQIFAKISGKHSRRSVHESQEL